MGIGGSAGSLTPLRQLLEELPADSGLAFVVVSHQAATGHSLLPEILAKTTAMHICELEGDTRATPNSLYVVPRGHSVAVRHGVLAIEPIGERRRVPLPIDSFFHSLARDQGRRAVGIVLSGTGSDGTLGLAAIRAAGGLSLAQDPETAEFEGMPASAIAAQAIDFALPIGEMPSKLLAFARASRLPAPDPTHSDVASEALERVLALIRVRGGHDFTAYKRDTLLRRVERRMRLHQIEEFADYVHHLESSDAEIDALWRDWLIGVSSFFRDPEVFQALAESGLPSLLRLRAADGRLRVWVPGCATGEEAYSIAITVLEATEALDEPLDVQIFATDLDPVAIEKARAGRYPKAIASGIGAERLARFFVEEEDAYRVTKKLRDHIVFAVQDVLHDPPFTRVDLISCRNLLIYIGPRAQQALLSSFHYSMNAGGLLLLGSSEHLGESTGLFSTLDKRWRLYQRNDAASAAPSFQRKPWATPATSHARARLQPPAIDPTEIVHRHLAERFAPPAAVVDPRGQIKHIHGRIGPYLELPSGRVNLNVVDMARQDLRVPLSSALREVTKAGAPAVEKVIRMNADGRSHSVRLTVEQIQTPSPESPLLLVSFALIAGKGAGRGRKRTPKRDVPERVELERELGHLREDLRDHVSDLQSANEELASANEEAQSANEELQSSNEELQTSKEETHSLNEELQTVNAELAEKLQSLEQANDDLLNLMSNIEIATIFLDDQLRVKRFTPQARSVARLIDSDVGRPLADLATLLDYPDLLADAQRVLSYLRPMEKQAPAPGHIWYTVRIRPYRTSRNVVEGLVVTFIDITATKRAERLQAARVLAEGIVDAVHEPLLALDSDLRIVRASRSFYQSFQVAPEDALGLPLASLGDGQWDVPHLRKRLEAILRDGLAFEHVEIVHERAEFGRRPISVSGRAVSMPGEETPVLVVLGIEETDREPVASPRKDGRE